MADPIRLALVGATGTLGKQILSALERSGLALSQLIPVASRATRVPSVSFAGHDIPVHDETTVDLAGADIILAAVPAAYEREAFQPALERGGVVVDASGLWGGEDEAPVVAPWANELELEQVLTAGVVRSPHPLSMALAAVGQPLHRALGLAGLRGAAMLPAGLAGRAGAEELSRQVIALFNNQEPPRSVFTEGLAFDLLPAWGALDAEGWTALEARAAEEAGALIGAEPRVLGITAVMSPIFAGMGLSLHAVTEGHMDLEDCRALLAAAPRITLLDRATKPLMTRARLDLDGLAVGRLRADPAGAGVHLWAACDPTRLAAVNAVELAVRIVENGYL